MLGLRAAASVTALTSQPIVYCGPRYAAIYDTFLNSLGQRSGYYASLRQVLRKCRILLRLAALATTIGCDVGALENRRESLRVPAFWKTGDNQLAFVALGFKTL